MVSNCLGLGISVGDESVQYGGSAAGPASEEDFDALVFCNEGEQGHTHNGPGQCCRSCRLVRPSEQSGRGVVVGFFAPSTKSPQLPRCIRIGVGSAVAMGFAAASTLWARALARNAPRLPNFSTSQTFCTLPFPAMNCASTPLRPRKLTQPRLCRGWMVRSSMERSRHRRVFLTAFLDCGETESGAFDRAGSSKVEI